MRFGKLTILTDRMNPCLAIAEELLKRPRTGNGHGDEILKVYGV